MTTKAIARPITTPITKRTAKTGSVPKTVPETASAAASVPANGHTPKTVQPDYKLIPYKDLQTSPTNPRRRIDEKTIETLAASIGTQGVLEPLIVRRDGKNYEIVCGERRYRAAKLAGLRDMPCLVRELSDEQVLDIQIHENLHREDIHPMDEALGYQFLKDKLNCDTKELALRVGKSEGYVLNRLKLNLLIKEAQIDIDKMHLPLVYALEMAKYPVEIQKVIYGEVYRKEGKYHDDDYVHVPVKGQTIPWKSFIEWIDTNIHRLLSKAPFDPKAGNLRDDGLACINCPDRTGAAISLFEPNQIGKKDACLNPPCYIQKSKRHIEVRRQDLAELRGVGSAEVPIVRSWGYSDGEGYFGTQSAVVISGAGHSKTTKPCGHSVSGVDIEADNYGKTVEVCLKATGCKIHWPEQSSTHPAEGKGKDTTEAEAALRLDNHRVRREEIWNAKVAEAVRIRVFKQAAESFERTFSIKEVGTDLLPQLIARLWRMTASGDLHNLNAVIKPLLAEWNKDSKTRKTVSMLEGRSGVDDIKKLNREMQYRILFLLIHCHKGSIYNGNRYTSQKEVRDLAAEFKVDHPLIDAEVRMSLCPKKHTEVHRLYLEAVRAKSKNAKVPRPFSDKWKASD